MESWGFLDGNSDKTFKLKATTQTYELSMDNLLQLFARELGVPAVRISITERKTFEHGDAIGEGHYVFGGLIVTVKAQ